MAITHTNGVLDRLFRPKHDYLPGTTIFRPVDVDKLAAELEVEKLGERDGRSEVPSSKSGRATATENTILARFNGYWDEAVNGARAAHQSYAARAAALTSTTDLETVVGEPDVIVRKLIETARSRRDDLKASRDRHVELSRDFDRFREAEGLERPVREDKNPAVKWLLLVVAATLELLINTSAFASGDEAGLAGAFLKVTAVPLLNIGVTFLLVFCLGRQVFRRPIIAKLLGLIGFGLAIAWAFGINLAVAHWRDSLGAAYSSQAGRIALDRVVHATFELQDINSWMLFGVGCVAAAIAAFDAVLWRDPHPGYTLRAAARNNAALGYAARRDWALYDLDALSGASIEKLKDALRSAETNLSRSPELIMRADALAEDLGTYEATLCAAAENVITRYREANQRARSTPPPPRFNAAVALKLKKVTLPKLAFAKSSGARSGLLSEAIRKISDGHQNAATLLPTLEEWNASEATP
jgi:hypothetical protein